MITWKLHRQGAGKPRAHAFRTMTSMHSICGLVKASAGERIDPDGTMEMCGKCLAIPSASKNLAERIGDVEEESSAGVLAPGKKDDWK